jgi:hypothetical protein
MAFAARGELTMQEFEPPVRPDTSSNQQGVFHRG